MDSVGHAVPSTSIPASQKSEPAFFLSRQILASFLAAFVLASGLGITFLIYRAQTVIDAIDASTPAPSLSPLSFYFVVAGSNPQNFITTDPAGVAFISWRYNHPVKIRYLVHNNVGAVDPAKRLRAMSFQYRDEAGKWNEAARASWSETEQGPHIVNLPEPHVRTASAEWRVVALEGGSDGELVMGWWGPSPSFSRFATFVNDFDLDLLMLLSCWIASTVWAICYPRKAGLILFIGGSVACIFVVNTVAFGLYHIPALWSADANTYLVWPPHHYRTPGINLIFVSVFHLIGFRGLHVLQLNMIVFAYLGALAWLAAATKRLWPFIPMTLFPIFWGNFVTHASYMLSEAWFLTGFLMAVSGLMALVFGAGRVASAWAGIGLLLAVCAKAVAAVLVVPAVLVYRFIPGSRCRRLGLVALTIAPSLLGYFAMSAYRYAYTGRFLLQQVGGVSLAGHIAWMLDPEDLPEEYRESGREAAAHVRAVYAGMPPMQDFNRYVDFTMSKYNEGLYAALKPPIETRMADLEPSQHTQDYYVKVNDLFAAWAKAAILRHPFLYTTHCALHFWGLWHYVLADYFTLGQSRRLTWEGFRQGDPTVNRINLPEYNNYRSYFPEYNIYNASWRQATEQHLLAIREYRLLSIPATEWRHWVSWFFFATALIASALFLVPVCYGPPVSAMITAALCANAYVAGQALFQVALPRYAEMIAPLFPLIFAMILIGVAEAIARRRLPYAVHFKWRAHAEKGVLRALRDPQ
jgi:hypothetical protein